MTSQGHDAGNSGLPGSLGAPVRARAGEQSNMACSAFVNVVDDDLFVREALGNLLQSMGYRVALYHSASDFLNAKLPDSPSCLVLDIRMPGTSGLELQEYLNQLNIGLPVILMTAYGDIPMSVKGMKAGAIDFLSKPIRDQDLLDAVATAVRIDKGRREDAAQAAHLRERCAALTPRERQVAVLVATGRMNKHIAIELSISEVTVKMHRGNAMRKLGVKSVANLARIADMLESQK